MDWFGFAMIGTVPVTLAIGWRYVSGEWLPPMLKRRPRPEPEIQQRPVFEALVRSKAAIRLEAKTRWLLSYEELLASLPLSANPLVRHWEGRQLLAVQREIHATVRWDDREEDRERQRHEELMARYRERFHGW